MYSPNAIPASSAKVTTRRRLITPRRFFSSTRAGAGGVGLHLRPCSRSDHRGRKRG